MREMSSKGQMGVVGGYKKYKQKPHFLVLAARFAQWPCAGDCRGTAKVADGRLEVVFLFYSHTAAAPLASNYTWRTKVDKEEQS